VYGSTQVLPTVRPGSENDDVSAVKIQQVRVSACIRVSTINVRPKMIPTRDMREGKRSSYEDRELK
jgi:hypothetical protein